MPVDKLYNSGKEALSCISDGDVVGVSGFEGLGEPDSLLRELSVMNVKNLKLVYDFPVTRNSAGADLITSMCANGKVERLISCNIPEKFQSSESGRLGNCFLEIIDRNLIAEKLRITGAGLAGVEFIRPLDGNQQVKGIRLDVALIKGLKSDDLGNVIYLGTQRNWSPVMAMAARITIAEVTEFVPAGEIDPEGIITPGIYINRIICPE